jgi:ethanolamine transporter
MEIISDTVIYIMMAFVLIGAVAAIRDDQGGIGKEFMQGLHSIGYLFIPVDGVIASLPYLSIFVEKVLGPIWSALGVGHSRHDVHCVRYGWLSAGRGNGPK